MLPHQGETQQNTGRNGGRRVYAVPSVCRQALCTVVEQAEGVEGAKGVRGDCKGWTDQTRVKRCEGVKRVQGSGGGGVGKGHGLHRGHAVGVRLRGDIARAVGCQAGGAVVHGGGPGATGGGVGCGRWRPKWEERPQQHPLDGHCSGGG